MSHPQLIKASPPVLWNSLIREMGQKTHKHRRSEPEVKQQSENFSSSPSAFWKHFTTFIHWMKLSVSSIKTIVLSSSSHHSPISIFLPPLLCFSSIFLSPAPPLYLSCILPSFIINRSSSCFQPHHIFEHLKTHLNIKIIPYTAKTETLTSVCVWF